MPRSQRRDLDAGSGIDTPVKKGGGGGGSGIDTTDEEGGDSRKQTSDDDEDPWVDDDPRYAGLNEETKFVMRERLWEQPGQEVPRAHRHLPAPLDLVCPKWLKPAAWWANYNATDDDFMNALKYNFQIKIKKNVIVWVRGCYACSAGENPTVCIASGGIPCDRCGGRRKGCGAGMRGEWVRAERARAYSFADAASLLAVSDKFTLAFKIWVIDIVADFNREGTVWSPPAFEKLGRTYHRLTGKWPTIKMQEKADKEAGNGPYTSFIPADWPKPWHSFSPTVEEVNAIYADERRAFARAPVLMVTRKAAGALYAFYHDGEYPPLFDVEPDVDTGREAHTWGAGIDGDDESEREGASDEGQHRRWLTPRRRRASRPTISESDADDDADDEGADDEGDDAAASQSTRQQAKLHEVEDTRWFQLNEQHKEQDARDGRKKAGRKKGSGKKKKNGDVPQEALDALEEDSIVGTGGNNASQAVAVASRTTAARRSGAKSTTMGGGGGKATTTRAKKTKTTKSSNAAKNTTKSSKNTKRTKASRKAADEEAGSENEGQGGETRDDDVDMGIANGADDDDGEQVNMELLRAMRPNRGGRDSQQSADSEDGEDDEGGPSRRRRTISRNASNRGTGRMTKSKTGKSSSDDTTQDEDEVEAQTTSQRRKATPAAKRAAPSAKKNAGPSTTTKAGGGKKPAPQPRRS